MKKYEFLNELNDTILPFWIKLLDYENGGSYGTVDYNLQLYKESPKGGVICARHLWSYSRAYLIMKDDSYLQAAEHSYQFLINSLWDDEHKGIFWLVDYKGSPLISAKHIYAQSFALYGLSEYAKISPNPEVLERAIRLFYLIEEKCFSEKHGGYFEEFTIDWKQKENELLNEGPGAIFTTNSHLHLLEAFTNLYSVWPNELLLDRITHLLDIFRTKIYNEKEHYCQVSFDCDWVPTKDTYSYGHDIETSWLLTETLHITKLDRPDILEMNKQIAYRVASEGIDADGSIYDAKSNGMVNKTRVWWAQAEAVIGFYNAYQLTKDETFITYSENVWKYIQEKFHDSRPNGEWYSRIDERGEVISSLRSEVYQTPENIADSWKGFYHNGRLCFEMLQRLPV
ncbi:AGE family epimerase/isomerase [Robertmurraya sp. GLU-23]